MAVYNELKQVSDLALFARVVEAGGISRCARQMGLERTTISRRIKCLEEFMGVRLLDRGLRTVTPSEKGRQCYGQAAKLIDIARDARTLIEDKPNSTSAWSIRVGAPAFALDLVVDEILANVASADLELGRIRMVPVDISSTESLGGVDMAFSIGNPGEKSGWAAELMPLDYIICCSPAYLERAGSVSEIAELKRHPWIVDSKVPSTHRWVLRDVNGEYRITTPNTVGVPGLLEVREAALAGMGICRLPLFVCSPWFSSGKLIRLLPDATLVGEPLFLVTTEDGRARREVISLQMKIQDATGSHQLKQAATQ